jgi:hypothetical protein
MPFSLRQLGRSVKPFLPPPVARALKRVYHHYLLPREYSRESVNDSAVAAEYGFTVVPPPDFRHRVHGEPNLRSFLEGGKFSYGKLVNGLSLAGRKSEDLRNRHRW